MMPNVIKNDTDIKINLKISDYYFEKININ